MKLEYSQQNLSILNFTKFISHYESLIVNDLYEYSLLNPNYTLGNKDIKKLFYHHLVKIIVDEFIWSNKSTNKLVAIFDKSQHIHGVLRDYYGEDNLKEFLERFILKLEKMLPVRFVVTSKTLNEYMMVNACLSKIKQVNKKEYTFQKIKLFAKRYDLTFLNDNYLNSLKTKQVLI